MEVSTFPCLVYDCPHESNLLQPLLSDPSAPLPPPIIPPLESSRPPVFSPEMTALLTSKLARPGASRTAKQLRHPPTLPQRADPESSDAKILGPLSKRREVNLRRRFFEEETARVQLPIEVSRVHVVQPSTSHGKPAETSTIEGAEIGDAEQLIPPSVGFQGTSVLRDLEAIASPNPNLPKRARNPSLQSATNSTPSTSTVNRFIRRQHRKLLGKIPILTYFKHPNSPTGKYQVSLSPLTNSGSLAGLTSAVPMADEADLAWLRLPPPPQELKVEMESTPPHEPKVKVEPMTKKPKPNPDRSPRVDEEFKRESNREERPRVDVKSGADHSPRVFLKPEYKIRLRPSRSNRMSGLPTEPSHLPKEDSKSPMHFDETTSERPKRGKFPPGPGSLPPKGIRLFKGNLVKKKGPDKPQPR